MVFVSPEGAARRHVQNMLRQSGRLLVISVTRNNSKAILKSSKGRMAPACFHTLESATCSRATAHISVGGAISRKNPSHVLEVEGAIEKY